VVTLTVTLVLLTISTASEGQAASRTFTPVSLVRVSASVVYVGGTVPCSTGDCASLLRSDDDGVTFHKIGLRLPPGVTAKSFVNAVSAAQFQTPSDGYIVISDKLYASTDAGRTWHDVNFGASTLVSSIATTPSFTYASVSTCGFVCSRSYLERSQTGSFHWSVVSVEHSAPLGYTTEVAGAVESRVWLLSGGAKGEVNLSLSNDAGRSFRVVWSEPMLYCRVYLTSARTVWLFCSGGMIGDLWRSTDGEHFVYLPYTVYHSDPFDPVSGAVAFYSLPDAPEVYRTMDGGQNFQDRGAVPVKQGEPADISFSNAEDGLALVQPTTGETAGASTLWRTTSGGTSWMKVELTRV